MDTLLTLRDMENIKICNDTKIKYLLVADSKIYKVTDIDFLQLGDRSMRMLHSGDELIKIVPLAVSGQRHWNV